VKKHFEEKGYYVIRSAGSHGIADLVAIGSGGVYLIQVKNHQLDDDGQKLLEDMAVKLISSTGSIRPENIRLAVAFRGENGIKVVSRPLIGWLQR